MTHLLLLSSLLACSGTTRECSESQLVAVFVDEDRDGYGDSARQQLVCEVGPQHATVGGDCDDTRSSVFPGAFEECDGLDNDCDGSIDEDLRVHTWYADEDGDGFGRASRTAQTCSAPPGFVDNDWDCDDADPLSHPGATEFCDGKDNDCDDLVDDEDPSTAPESMPTWYKDNDVDGFGGTSEQIKQCTPPQNGAWVKNADDCDDANKAVNPDAPEICNEIDDDCDGHVDDSDVDIDPAYLTTFYYDGDGDGVGDSTLTVLACDAPWFHVAVGGDCDDDEPALQDETTGWWVRDADADGYAELGGAAVGPACAPPGPGFALQAYATDCDDDDPAVFPGAVEICDEVDNDCDTLVDDEDDDLDASTGSTFWADADGDGFGDPEATLEACALPADAAPNPDDCDDEDDRVNPDAVEVCNGQDDDCDGRIDDADPDLDPSSLVSWYFDFDLDGHGDPTISVLACAPPPDHVPLGDDCDDDDPDRSPSAPEICGDGIDQDCDGLDPSC